MYQQDAYLNQKSPVDIDLLSFEDHTTLTEQSDTFTLATSGSLLSDNNVAVNPFGRSSSSLSSSSHSLSTIPAATSSETASAPSFPPQYASSMHKSVVHVCVSGVAFSIPRNHFCSSFIKLPWQRHNENGNQSFHLNTSSAIFEVLFNYVCCDGVLPVCGTLTRVELEELEPLALILGLHDLVEHFHGSSKSGRHYRRWILRPHFKGWQNKFFPLSHKRKHHTTTHPDDCLPIFY